MSSLPAPRESLTVDLFPGRAVASIEILSKWHDSEADFWSEYQGAQKRAGIAPRLRNWIASMTPQKREMLPVLEAVRQRGEPFICCIATDDLEELVRFSSGVSSESRARSQTSVQRSSMIFGILGFMGTILALASWQVVQDSVAKSSVINPTQFLVFLMAVPYLVWIVSMNHAKESEEREWEARLWANISLVLDLERIRRNREGKKAEP